jgi:hypothetical protein
MELLQASCYFPSLGFYMLLAPCSQTSSQCDKPSYILI